MGRAAAQRCWDTRVLAVRPVAEKTVFGTRQCGRFAQARAMVTLFAARQTGAAASLDPLSQPMEREQDWERSKSIGSSEEPGERMAGR